MRFRVGQIGDPQRIRGLGVDLATPQLGGAPAGLAAEGGADRRRAPHRAAGLEHRATRVPSRRSCAHTLSAPYTPRFSLKTRVISGFNASSRPRRADGGQAIAAWYAAGANASPRQIGSMPPRSRWGWG